VKSATQLTKYAGLSKQNTKKPNNESAFHNHGSYSTIPISGTVTHFQAAWI